jgi:PAS domain S-box-containing protein
MSDKTPELLKLLQNIVDSSIDGILAVDREYRYTLWNNSMETISGRQRSEVLGRVAFDVFPFLKSIGEDEMFRRGLAGEVVQVTDRRYSVPESGREGFYEAVYSPIVDQDDRVVGCLGVIRDITEQRIFRKDLEESERRHRSLTEFATDAIISCDESGIIHSWNRAASIMFDYPEQEAVGHSLDRLVPGGFWRDYLREARLVTPDSPPFGHREELTGFRKFGSSFPVEVTLSSWKRDGKTFLSAIMRDITERRHLEMQAEERAEFQAALMQAQSDLGEGVAVIDIVEGRLLHANSAFVRMAGYSLEELMSMKDLWVLVAPEQKELAQRRVFSRARSAESSEYYETVAYTKDGNRVNVDLAVKTLETSHGFSVVVLVRDITQRKHTESALRESERIKQRLSEMNQNVIADVSVNGVINSLSPAFQQVTKMEPKQWVGKKFVELCHPESQNLAIQGIRRALDGKSNPLVRVKLAQSEGRWTDVELFASPKFMEGRIGGAFLIIRDVSEELKREQEILEEQLRFQALAETSSEGVAVVGKGLIIEVNQTFAKMFGFDDPQEVIGLNPSQLVADESSELVMKNIREGIQAPYRVVCRRTDGTLFPAEVHGKNFFYRGREIRVSSIRELPGRDLPA